MKAIEKIKKELAPLGFDFNATEDTGGIFGSVNISLPERRVLNDRHKFGNINLYVSGRLYGNSKKSFIYAICYQKAVITPYRCKRSYEAELNKIYVSGKTINDVLSKLIPEVKQAFNKRTYSLTTN